MAHQFGAQQLPVALQGLYLLVAYRLLLLGSAQAVRHVVIFFLAGLHLFLEGAAEVVILCAQGLIVLLPGGQPFGYPAGSSFGVMLLGGQLHLQRGELHLPLVGCLLEGFELPEHLGKFLAQVLEGFPVVLLLRLAQAGSGLQVGVLMVEHLGVARYLPAGGGFGFDRGCGFRVGQPGSHRCDLLFRNALFRLERRDQRLTVSHDLGHGIPGAYQLGILRGQL